MKYRSGYIKQSCRLTEVRFRSVGCPNFAIDSRGFKIFHPATVKDLYLRKGTTQLRTKLSLFEEKACLAPDPPLSPYIQIPLSSQKGHSLSVGGRYNRNAKGIAG